MVGGYLIMFAFTVVMMGRGHGWVECRILLALAGILGVAMGLVAAVGINSVLGFPYTPMHTLLPFLLLGISTAGHGVQGW